MTTVEIVGGAVIEQVHSLLVSVVVERNTGEEQGDNQVADSVRQGGSSEDIVVGGT